MSEDGGGASRTTDPAAGTSTATDVSLREYLTQRIDAVEKRSEARFESMEQALKLADVATERRFEGVNEFRATLSDQAQHFVTIETLNAIIERLTAQAERNRDAIFELSKRIDRREGEESGSRITKGSLYTAFGAAIAFLGLMIVLANYLTTH
jgi:hypothetical protein